MDFITKKYFLRKDLETKNKKLVLKSNLLNSINNEEKTKNTLTNP